MTMYCITHESWTNPELMDYVPDECILVHSAPPDLPENWDELVTEPSDEELSQMDANAESLLADLAL